MPGGYHHLTYEERCQIYALKQRGDSLAQIARQLRVDKSTVSREIRRNTGGRGYRYKQAHEYAKERRKLASRRPRKMDEAVIRLIREKLSLQWSPDQIAGWLRLHHRGSAVSYETIYQYIWADKHMGGTLYKHLRHKGKKRANRGNKHAGRGCIPNRVGIEKRPKIVEKKVRIGDWELDTVVGRQEPGAIVSMVDRASKLARLVNVPSKHADIVAKALIDHLGCPELEVLTMTADNGKEFARHEQIATALGAEFFFANPYHSWERGLNEHTNGLLRQYLPKGQSLKEITQADLDKIETLLNTRPRKALQYATPLETFHHLKRATMQH